MNGVSGTRRLSKRLAGIGKVPQDVMEHQLAANPGRQDPLDVLHDKDSRPAAMEDSEVLPVKKVSVVFLCNIVGLSPVARPANK